MNPKTKSGELSVTADEQGVNVNVDKAVRNACPLCVPLSADDPRIDDELKTIIEVWHALPELIRSALVTLAQTAGKQPTPSIDIDETHKNTGSREVSSIEGGKNRGKGPKR